MEEYPRDLTEFEALFATEEACRAYLGRLRWPGRFPVFALWGLEILASPGRVATVRWLWTPDFGDRRNYSSGYAQPFEVVVSPHVVGDYPEEWCQRFGPPVCVGSEAVPDHLDMAAQIA
jgi:hypothetical protein